MAENQWILKEDGYLNVDTKSQRIVYHPTLNVLLVFTENNEIKVLDVNSGVVLQSCCLSVEGRTVNCKYLPRHEKILFWDGLNIGLRGDYNGVLLLDTILQPPIQQSDDKVRLELLLSEAGLFLQSFKSLDETTVESSSDVSKELTEKITDAQSNVKKWIKAQKWNTVCIELPHSSIKTAASNVVFNLKRHECHIPALSIASAINERLTDLMVGLRQIETTNAGNSQRYLMYSEVARRETFNRWPHMDYKWALPNQMAQAGFFHQPSATGDDRAMCFTCNICLVCWEKTDNPWSEHERHSPSCPFVRGDFTQNVPLAITYATSPAIATTGFDLVSRGDHGNVICTGNSEGQVTVWDVKGQLRRLCSFNAGDDFDNYVTEILLKAMCTYQISVESNQEIQYNTNIACAVTIRTADECEQAIFIYGLVKNAQAESDLVNTPPSKVTEPEKISTKTHFSNNKPEVIPYFDPWMHKLTSDIYSEVHEELKKGQSKAMAGPSTDGSSSICTQLDDSVPMAQPPPPITTKIDTDTQCVSLQCMPLPKEYDGYEIVDIMPSYDEHWLLIILRYSGDGDLKSDNHQTDVYKMDVDNEDDEMGKPNTGGVKLLLFEISEGFISVTAHISKDFPANSAPIEICMLPTYPTINADNRSCANVFAMITEDGSLKLSDFTLSIVSSVQITDTKFVSVTYCKNLERLCACTETGILHFYSFFDTDLYSDDDQDEKPNLIVSDDAFDDVCNRTEIDGLGGSDKLTEHLPSISPLGDTINILFYALRTELTLADLKAMYSLTLFDDRLTPYAADVSACWNELVHAQKQRRCPQNFITNDDDRFSSHLVKSWRLHNDATTWDEHIIEITLPQQASMGHIDFRFSFYPQCTIPPAIQITLLKQNTSGFVYRKRSGVAHMSIDSIANDEQVDFKMDIPGNNKHNPFLQNPVLTEDYLRLHNAEILVGPIEMSSCVDLTGQGGLVTLTSPKLFKTKSRHFLLHIKTMVDPFEQGKTRGCDWLHEISIAIRNTKSTPHIRNERLQRNAMLESNLLLENLMKILSQPDATDSEKTLSLDILLWIVMIRLNRYRSPKISAAGLCKNSSGSTKSSKIGANTVQVDTIDMSKLQMDCISIVQGKLYNLIRNCILFGNRTTAHKCIKVIITAMEGVSNMEIDKTDFSEAFKNAILNCLPDLSLIKYSGSLRWLTLLISSTPSAVSYSELFESFIRSFLDVTIELSKRSCVYTSILRSRFGLLPTPFEPELFEAKLSLAKFNYYTNISTNSKGPAGQTNIIDVKRISGNDPSFMPRLFKKVIKHQLRGLLEVEPLHYVCCASSEATRLENMEPNSIGSVPANSFFEDIIFESPHTNLEANEINKTDKDDELINLPFVISMDGNLSYNESKGTSKSNDIKNDDENSFISIETTPPPVQDEQKSSTIPLATMEPFEPSNTSNESNTISDKVQQYLSDKCIDENNSTAIPWHRLLTIPAKQMMVVERMHSGARRFVTFDFGSPILLTDLIFPACEDLALIFLDVWSNEEETDSIRLATASDISTKSLILTDLQPPVSCRFIKITVTGRFGMSATRCKIPIGSFFGHIAILENDANVPMGLKTNITNIPAQLKALNALYEDVHCRYSLASARLIDLLDPLLHSDISNVAHMQGYLNKIKDNTDTVVDHAKVLAIYDDCITLQNQLSVVRNVMERLELSVKAGGSVVLGAMPTNVADNSDETKTTKASDLSSLPSDKLRVLCECLTEVLICFVSECGNKNVPNLYKYFDQPTCKLLFEIFITSGWSSMQAPICALLMRMCSFQPWWGDFLATSLTELFSSQNTKVFPQERVFFVLTMLGKKSMSNQSCRAIVIDAILQTITCLLLPIAKRAPVPFDPDEDNDQFSTIFSDKTELDYQLINWMLLFLAICLDSDAFDRKDTKSARWDFMSADTDLTKVRPPISTTTGRSFTRSFKKRYLQAKHHNTANGTEKILYTSHPESAAIQVAHLTSQIELVMKKHEYLSKFPTPSAKCWDKMKMFTKFDKTKTADEPMPAGSANTTQPIKQDSDRFLKISNTIVVVRGLFSLLLSMDYTFNMDMFLLTCKIISRLISLCRPNIQLANVLTKKQLRKLVTIAVWRDQQQPWAIHSITCLLQDLLETDKNYRRNFSGNDDTSPSDTPMDILVDTDPIDSGTSSSESTKSSSNYLPSLMECEDAELEEMLNDIFMTRNQNRKDLSLTNRAALNLTSRGLSSAMDGRMDTGIQTNIEIALKRSTMLSAMNLFTSFTQVYLSDTSSQIEPPSWPDRLMEVWTGDKYATTETTHQILGSVFDEIFRDAHLADSWLNLDQLLEIWLSMNGEISEKSIVDGLTINRPKIPLSLAAIDGLMTALAEQSDVKLRTWCLGFYCLILACNPDTNGISDPDYKRLNVIIVQNPNFERMLYRFYSATDTSLSDNQCVGPTICKLLHELYVWLKHTLAEIHEAMEIKEKLKEILMRILLKLLDQNGAIVQHNGPIDGQNELIKELFFYQYNSNDVPIALKIIESVAYLIHKNVSSIDRLYCDRSSNPSNSNATFANLFATVLNTDTGRQSDTVTDNFLLINLLKLISKLIQQIPLSNDSDQSSGQNMFNECQTDETKAEQQINQENVRQSTPCIADTVLLHPKTMSYLFDYLSKCSCSSFELLEASSDMNSSEAVRKISKHTVAGSVFCVMLLLNRLASSPQLIVQPLCDYLNSTLNQRNILPKFQLSESFIWFILKVLESPTNVAIFTERGGIRFLCSNLIKSHKSFINMQPSLVSVIMQNVNKWTTGKPNQASGTTGKKATPSTKTSDGLINFAPLCSISAENSTAQGVDALIQAPIASHRRARTPAWNHLFYPNDTHLDLTLTLPTAILLKEIHLQPHAVSLATCPSAVAIEISRDGNLPSIPLSAPIPTMGLTCIRLKLTQPEIASSIILRLYRPKDSINMGLTQISILGTSVFTEIKPNGTNDMTNDDDSLVKGCLGWLRILARCFSFATFMPNIQLINIAAEHPGFIESCCHLFNITTTEQKPLLNNLESILLKIGLHTKDLGLKLIKNLLQTTLPQTFKLCNESVANLLYDLCTTPDPYAKDRINLMVKWAKNLFYACYQHPSHRYATNPWSGYLKCLASILWTAHTTNLHNDLQSVVTIELFDSMYRWLEIINGQEQLKKSIDAMICSICSIRSELFQLLMEKMTIVQQQGATDDQKSTNIVDLTKLKLTPCQLRTLAIACQSPAAVQQLLDSGLPRLLAVAILEYCNACDDETIELVDCLTDSAKSKAKNLPEHDFPMVNIVDVAKILEFFSEICAEGQIRDWLGSFEGSVFWKPLLELLCNSKRANETLNQASNDSTFTSYSALQSATIKFLSRVTACHPKNQDTLTIILINVIKRPAMNQFDNKTIISGFTRRLVLQLLLESERIYVSIRSDLPLQKRDSLLTPICDHPSKRSNAHQILFYLSTQTKCQEILEKCMSQYNKIMMQPSSQCFDHSVKKTDLKSSINSEYRDARKEMFEFNLGLGTGMEILSVAAGVTAKDKRLKEAKNQVAALKSNDLMSLFKIKHVKNLMNSTVDNCIQLTHFACPGVILNSDTTISQILAMLQNAGVSLATPCITLDLIHCQNKMDDSMSETQLKAADIEPLPSPLQIFSYRGGLSLLAHYLPPVYPDIPKSLQQSNEKEKSPPLIGEWIKVEQNDDIYEDLDDGVGDPGAKLPLITAVPPHSLAAFGLFLRLPAYSEVLLRDKIRAQCLLRLVLGVTGDGEGNEIYSLALASSLPTSPFEVFKQLLDSSPLTTEDGVLLRRMIIEVGAMHLVLNCLGIFTHQPQAYQISNPQADIHTPPIRSNGSIDDQIASDDKSHVYWAKGTGFGTGSVHQSWNVEQALMRQKSEEQHVTILLQVISSYINPNDRHSSEEFEIFDMGEKSGDLPPLFFELLQQSCLIPALSSYLRNDSVLDITRHIPLYRAVLQLLRAIALSSQLLELLKPHRTQTGTTSIAALLMNMKNCVDSYASRLKVNKKSNIKGQKERVTVTFDDGDDEGLALLIPDIEETASLIQNATKIVYTIESSDDENQETINRMLSMTIEERYLEVMKPLQFDSHDMIVECDTGTRFVVSYHFENNVRTAGDRQLPARMKRLAQETVTLSTSLPLSFSSSVFVRCDTDRLDVMKVLITGPADTPYANGCFEFDVYFPPEYPAAPMMINLETTGVHTVRFNPNLYNDGKVCLSVLNTWHGRPEEKWNAQTSSFLQVLVSIQSLILVPEPYFNEPGYERNRGSPMGNNSSREYNCNIYLACVRWAMLEQIRKPCPCFKKIIHTHFWLKRNEICEQIERWITEMGALPSNEVSGQQRLRNCYKQLREEFEKLATPEGFEDFDNPFMADPSSVPSKSSMDTDPIV